MNYRVVWKPAPGYSRLVKPGDAGLQYLGFGMLSLAPGKKHTFAPCDKETALVLLKGSAKVSATGLAAQTIGPRANLFTDRPWTVLLPAQCACEVEATTDTEIAVCLAPSTRTGTPLVIGPDKVKEMNLGKPGWQRRALIMVDENVPADLLFIGEAFVSPGNWASYPPHRHDYDDLPYEVDMEEVYYFRFDKPQAFGIQKIYTDNRSIDETLTVGEHHTVLIPEGYHPVAAVPGYPMYYLWVMAGKNRRFLSRLDPDHVWMTQS
jgi:5-deoxy-glucuronate isomerase